MRGHILNTRGFCTRIDGGIDNIFKSDVWPGMENSRTFAYGYVKTWKHYEGWGIIIDENEINYDKDNQCEYWVHWSDITGYNVPWLDVGERVSFEIVEEDQNNVLHEYIPRSHLYINSRKKIYKHYEYHPDREKSNLRHNGYDRFFTGSQRDKVKLRPKTKRRDLKKPHKRLTLGYDNKPHKIIAQYITNKHGKFREAWCNNFRAINVHQLNRINWAEDNTSLNDDSNSTNDIKMNDDLNVYETMPLNQENINVIEYRESLRNTDKKYKQTTRDKIDLKYGKNILKKDKKHMNDAELTEYNDNKRVFNREYPYGINGNDIENIDLKKYTNWFPELL